MASTRQLTYRVLRSNRKSETVESFAKYACNESFACMRLLARKYRCIPPKAEEIRIGSPRFFPPDTDRRDLVLSLISQDGYLNFVVQATRLPWYRGWVNMLVARWLLGRLHWRRE